MRAVVVVLSLVLVLASATSARAQDPAEDWVSRDKIFVQVNGDVITEFAYQEALSILREELKKDMKGKSDGEIEAEYEKQKPRVLDRMIGDLLLEQRARDLGIDVEAEVEQELRRVAKEAGLKDVWELGSKMREDGIDIEDARSSLRKERWRQYVLEREVAHPLMSRGATQKEIEAAIPPYLKELRDNAFIKITNPSP